MKKLFKVAGFSSRLNNFTPPIGIVYYFKIFALFKNNRHLFEFFEKVPTFASPKKRD
jgi:hypothetical protein